MRKIILLGLVISLLLIAGCGQQLVCNKPYILVGNDCCLDKNDNSICDKDETEIERTKCTSDNDCVGSASGRYCDTKVWECVGVPGPKIVNSSFS